MKYYKGTLYHYFATGEVSHYYVWLGDPKAEQHNWEHHLVINSSDIVEVRSDNRKNGIILRYFPETEEELKKSLRTKGWKVWVAAVKEHWEVEVVKFENSNTFNN